MVSIFIFEQSYPDLAKEAKSKIGKKAKEIAKALKSAATFEDIRKAVKKGYSLNTNLGDVVRGKLLKSTPVVDVERLKKGVARSGALYGGTAAAGGAGAYLYKKHKDDRE